jgi:hypothetical protein
VFYADAGEHLTAQARIVEYAEAIDWTFVSREQGEQRRGFASTVPSRIITTRALAIKKASYTTKNNIHVK